MEMFCPFTDDGVNRLDIDSVNDVYRFGMIHIDSSVRNRTMQVQDILLFSFKQWRSGLFCCRKEIAFSSVLRRIFFFPPAGENGRKVNKNSENLFSLGPIIWGMVGAVKAGSENSSVASLAVS